MSMIDAQQRTAPKKFADFWKDKGYEKGDNGAVENGGQD